MNKNKFLGKKISAEKSDGVRLEKFYPNFVKETTQPQEQTYGESDFTAPDHTFEHLDLDIIFRIIDVKRSNKEQLLHEFPYISDPSQVRDDVYDKTAMAIVNSGVTLPPQ